MTKPAYEKRKSNIEWLRVIAMLMVVSLHALGKGGLLQDGVYPLSCNGSVAWLLESFSIVAVNLYVLITGYLLAEADFKSQRLVSLLLEILFYSLGGFFVFKAIGVTGETDFYTFLSCALPVHMDTYWFMTSYVVLYLFLPVLVRALKNMGKKQLGSIILLLLVYECGFKTLLPFTMGIEDHGYSFLWFLVIFLTAAYFRKFGFGKLKASYKGLILFLACGLLIFSEAFAIAFVSEKYGHLELLKRISYDYNHLFVYLGAIGLFAFGMNRSKKDGVCGKIGVFLGKYTLGVYLLHEHPLIRYEWGKWFGLDTLLEASAIRFILTLAVAILCVFAVGILVDIIRSYLFKLVGGFSVFSPLREKMQKLDRVVNGTEDI